VGIDLARVDRQLHLPACGGEAARVGPDRPFGGGSPGRGVGRAADGFGVDGPAAELLEQGVGPVEGVVTPRSDVMRPAWRESKPSTPRAESAG